MPCKRPKSGGQNDSGTVPRPATTAFTKSLITDCAEESGLVPRAEKTWHLLAVDAAAAGRLAAAANVSPVVAQLLINREVTEAISARRFLECPLSGLYPPIELPGVAEAAKRLALAVAGKRKICVYGDYDADGVTGAAILHTLLTRLGAEVKFHTPLRLSEGYGLNAERLKELAREGVSLVVSVDCGIASIAEAETARELGLELIVTDHHEMKLGLDGPLLPAAACIVHPRLPGSNYPFGELSGAGVALKLAWAVAQIASGSEKVSADLRELLLDCVGLAALGLVADVVPLHDENRILVKHGLERIRAKPSAGLRALLECAGVKPESAITAEDVGFRLAPRLNAAGRLGCARLAVELLTTTSAPKAAELAQYLETQNAQRQAIERRITHEARLVVERDFPNDPAVVVGGHGWHAGVVGIVASRLVDHFARPALVIAVQPGEVVASGSGRSVPGFALHAALRACDELLEGHGGHAAAVGFKVRPERIDALRNRFNAYVAGHFPGGSACPRLVLDAEVPLAALTFGLMRDLDKLEPYGAGNPKPKFLASGMQVESPRLIGKEETKKHLDFRVRQGGIVMRCVAWNMADRMDELMSAGGNCCIAFTPRINEWQGSRRIELQVIDLKPGKSVELG
jgi:single-stranded-DNA-specific exonuclease